MDWTQVLTIIGTMSALFLWNRSESRADARRTMDVLDAINLEIKDFHGRLCSLEARWHGKPFEEEKKEK